MFPVGGSYVPSIAERKERENELEIQEKEGFNRERSKKAQNGHLSNLTDIKEICQRNSVFIGIDCGLSGAVAAVGANREVIGLFDTPIVKVEGRSLYDCSEMAAILRSLALKGNAVVVLEQQQAMPGQGVSSTFSIGYGFGLWAGLLSALEIPFQTVRPSVWVRKVLAGCPGEGKARSIGFVMRMYPGVELVPPGCRKPRDGRADALCLATFGIMTAA
jgi:crossover junction endodeoxyribonuclease RuvC